MSNEAELRILPMKTAGTQHFIERTYRESGAFQWVRETYKNAEEAGATRIEFGIEWQAVEDQGVYRRLIADDGVGMTPEQLVEFFNTFGGGGKPIGGLHENYGVGSKTSLLPWNHAGMIVVSYVDGEGAMIEVQRDPSTGEYGLRLQPVEDEETGEESLDEVYAPYDDPARGCDWSAVKPDWIENHGTVIVLLGNDPSEDTVLGDRARQEEDIKGISTYLNRRLWEVPDGIELYVDELRTQSRGDWPRSEEEAHGVRPGGKDRRTNMRQIRGARYYVRYPVPTYKKGALSASGSVVLKSGTEILWYLWGGERPAVQSYAAVGGFIGALYENELYDVMNHRATYRSFGITEREVRSRVWLIMKPPLADSKNGKHGVYPRTDRNSLLVKGGPNAGGPLPINDWAAEFATSHMPDQIVDAIQKARAKGGGTVKDKVWRERLADRFGSRWRIPKLRARKGGPHTVDATQAGGKPKKIKRVKRRTGAISGGTGGTGGTTNTGTTPGKVAAVRTRVGGAIPNYRPVNQSELEEGMLAAWQPHDPTEPNGVVLINVEHPVLRAEIEHWQSQFPDHLAEQVGDEVVRVYGEMAVAKVAHSEHLKGIIPSKEVEDGLRSPSALTMSLLGLIGEEAVLAPRVGGKFSKKAA